MRINHPGVILPKGALAVHQAVRAVFPKGDVVDFPMKNRDVGMDALARRVK
ncbi:MAG: hypothetical protein M1418_02160 [Deltaproteobacteria bacterium]|nr:hypothetical protein [Deltaproteobacteria bacterium]